jgi:hypothetical protein
MLQNIQDAIKIRVLVVFVMVHIGLAMGIYALGRSSAPNGWDETSTFFLLGIVFLYGGFLLSVFFILWTVVPWVKKAQKVEHWSERLIRDLPLLIEHLPKVVATIQALVASWKESHPSSKDSAPVPKD